MLLHCGGLLQPFINYWSKTDFFSLHHRKLHWSAVRLCWRSIMAKSFVYFSAGVSGESRPLALARDDERGLCRNVVAQCNIVYEKEPANGQARAVCRCYCRGCCTLCCTKPSARRENGPVARTAWLRNFFNYVTTKFARGENSYAYCGIAGPFRKHMRKHIPCGSCRNRGDRYKLNNHDERWNC